MNLKLTHLTALAAFSLTYTICSAQSNLKPEDTELHGTLPVVRTFTDRAPSDAIVLFDGTGLDAWVSSKDVSKSTGWNVHDGIFTSKPGSGDIQTKQHFDDFQLHVEWMSPTTIKGEGQGRGNSGIFLQGIYELQVLDNNHNPTYINGQAGSIYKQQPPLVTAIKDIGEWHTYDILYTAPVFNKDGVLIKKGNITVLHNGIVIHYNTQIEGTTEYIGLPKIKPHGAGPIKLQDHGD
jgi:hypothetical protein